MTLLEHVRDNRRALQSIFDSLNQGGLTLHYVPSKWHPYSVATRAVGPDLQRRLIRLLKPSAIGVSGYPRFSYVLRPSDDVSPARVGFRDIEIRCFFRTDYFVWCVPLLTCREPFQRGMPATDLSTFASGMIVQASK